MKLKTRINRKKRRIVTSLKPLLLRSLSLSGLINEKMAKSNLKNYQPIGKEKTNLMTLLNQNQKPQSHKRFKKSQLRSLQCEK